MYTTQINLSYKISGYFVVKKLFIQKIKLKWSLKIVHAIHRRILKVTRTFLRLFLLSSKFYAYTGYTMLYPVYTA